MGLNWSLQTRSMSDIGEKIWPLIKEMLEKADELDELHRTVNEVHVAGNMASAVGSAATLVGIFTAPFTWGTSLALTVGSFTGGIASGGASIHQQTAEIRAMKTMYDRVKKFVEEIDTPDLRFKYAELVMSLGSVLKDMKDLISAGVSFISSGVSTALVSFGVSVYMAVTAAVQLINNRGSEGGNYLRELARQLEEFASKP